VAADEACLQSLDYAFENFSFFFPSFLLFTFSPALHVWSLGSSLETPEMDTGTISKEDPVHHKAFILLPPNTETKLQEVTHESEALYAGCPLQTTRREIRLLVLGSEFGPPGKAHCFMKTVPLDSPSLKFVAVSYAWGDPRDDIQIQVNRKSVRITRTLESALRHIQKLRFRESQNFDGHNHVDRKLAIWADALCIDQSTTLEKNHQVAMMMSIYEKATQVVVWLGDSDELSEEAVNFIKDSKNITRKPPLFGDTSLAAFSHLLDSSKWNCVMSLLQRSWFQRLWVVQEISAPKDVQSIRILCGDSTISWLEFTSVFLWLQRILKDKFQLLGPRLGLVFAPSHRLAIPRAIQMAKIRRKYQKSGVVDKSAKLDLLYLINSTKYLHASNPRDRIYALLGLVEKDHHLAALNPDYSKSTSQLNTQLFKYIVESSRRLSILALAPYRTVEIGELPSWAPDLTYRWGDGRDALATDYVCSFDEYNLASFSASLDRLAVYRFSDALDLFFVRGLYYDAIISVNEFIVEKNVWNRRDFATLIDIWRVDALKNDESGPYGGFNERINAFWRTLVVDVDPDTRTSPSSDKYGSIFKSLLDGEPSGKLHVEDEMMRYMRRVVTSCKDRRFFITKKGYMGLGNLGTKPGDCVCILFGGPTPFIIRDLDAGHHQFISDAYVHGVMYGEALAEIPKEAEQEFVLR
jgi:hypothetical protein